MESQDERNETKDIKGNFLRQVTIYFSFLFLMSSPCYTIIIFHERFALLFLLFVSFLFYDDNRLTQLELRYDTMPLCLHADVATYFRETTLRK